MKKLILLLSCLALAHCSSPNKKSDQGDPIAFQHHQPQRTLATDHLNKDEVIQHGRDSCLGTLPATFKCVADGKDPAVMKLVFFEKEFNREELVKTAKPFVVTEGEKNAPLYKLDGFTIKAKKIQITAMPRWFIHCNEDYKFDRVTFELRNAIDVIHTVPVKCEGL